MSVLVPAVDAAALVAFVVAVWLLARVPSRGRGTLSGVAKACLMGALLVYAFAMFSNVLEHAGVTDALDAAEDYVEMLFPPLIVYAAYALYVRQRENELLSAQRAAARSQALALGILDAAPAGIIVLDDVGRITFANETAREVLDLTETDSGEVQTPGWSVRVAGGPSSLDFAGLVVAEHGLKGIPVTVKWQNGWRVELTVRTDRLIDESGRFGGLVGTFMPETGLHQE
ncbi:MAG: PAS domain-containing protein [Coriobacteriia bacterium]|nr:PAS domain-containing protein [Coriobacteriia bacterium]